MKTVIMTRGRGDELNSGHFYSISVLLESDFMFSLFSDYMEDIVSKCGMVYEQCLK